MTVTPVCPHFTQLLHPSATMRHSWTLLFVTCVVMAFHFEASGAQFSFSLPGKWGNGKRGLGFGKRTDCTDFDPEALFNLYKTIQVEASRINQCMQAKMEEEGSKH